jgi:putative ABC transport system permease protein
MSTAEAIRSGYDWLFTNWYSNNFYTYLLLPEGYDATKLVSKLGDFDKRHRQNGSSAIHHYALEKLTDIYLHSKRNNQAGKTGSITNLYIFSSVAIFMLLIACINFVNLSTARSVIRAKEVGVKKVAGASRAQVITQFFSESFLMSALSLLLAIAAVFLILPYFNTFSGKSFSVDLFSPFHLLVLFILLLIIGLLSGTYPAIVLSAYKPVAALKGKASASVLSISVRKALVIFQFAISVILIICSTVVFTQLQYMQQHDLGFKPSQTMVINFEGDKAVQTKYKTIRQELLGIPGIQSITASSNVPGDGNVGSWSMNFAKKNGDTLKTELSIYLTDFTFLQQYNIPMVAGRSFSEQYAADTTESMLINETALRKLGFSSAAEAIGVKVDMYPKDAKVIGVYKDFHFQSLQKAVEPLAMRILPRNFRLLSIQIESLNVRQTVEAIEKEWKQLVPERPMEFTFLDESFNKQYDSEIKFAQVFSVFTTIAIIIACLGLFGLALFSVQQRTKEIGIRKVLGASIVNIGAMLSKDFIVLVVVAILVASPIGWYAMNRWLQDFEYRISISWWIFILAGVAAIMIAVLTICYHTIKAGMANPVTSLRTE